MTSIDREPQARATQRRPLTAPAVGSNVATLFLDRVARTPAAPAYQAPAGEGWRTFTWHDTGERVRDVAGGLLALGLRAGERVAIVAMTSVDWIVADLGVMCAAGVTTTIYPSNTADECAFVISDSESRFAFAEDDAQVTKILQHRGALPGLEHIIVFDGSESDDGFVLTLASLEARGAARRATAPEEIDDIARAIPNDALATLIYTSGTTGRPKGVELTHDAWLYTSESLESCRILDENDVQLLWLPLAHSFAKAIQILSIHIGFMTAVDGRQEKLVDNFQSVRPTFVAAVPRVFEKVFNKVVAGAKEGGEAKYRVFQWALGVGRRVSMYRQRGQELPTTLDLKARLADRLVFSKLRARFGGRLRFFVSGSAPLSSEIAEFFHAAGVLVLEGYGLTESSAASFLNLPTRYRFGSVGPPVPGTEVKIAKEDGEVLIRSRGVMRGYHNLPHETAEVLDNDGWLHTGDIGVVDQAGFLHITDRKKDLIKTSVGKYVAPQMLEGKLKARCPLVSQVLVHGNARPYCVALVTLDEGALQAWAEEHHLGALSNDALLQHPRVKEEVQRYVDSINSEHARFEQIKKFSILPTDLTLEGGELTPTLKVKRKVVEQKYKATLDAMYRS